MSLRGFFLVAIHLTANLLRRFNGSPLATLKIDADDRIRDKQQREEDYLAAIAEATDRTIEQVKEAQSAVESRKEMFLAMIIFASIGAVLFLLAIFAVA